MKEAVLIFGVSSGIGIRLSQELLNNNFLVIGTYNANASFKSKIKNKDNLHLFNLDVQDEGAIKFFIERDLKKLLDRKEIEALSVIYACGKWHSGKMENWNIEDFDSVHAINVKAPCIIAASMMAAFKKRPLRFVFFTGLAGDTNAVKGNALYGMCCTSISFMTKVLSREIAERKKSACLTITLGLFDKGQPYFNELMNAIDVDAAFSLEDIVDYLFGLLNDTSKLVLLNGTAINMHNNIFNYKDVIEWFKDS